jgi:hypothetical protein
MNPHLFSLVLNLKEIRGGPLGSRGEHPQHIQGKMGITPAIEVDFIEEKSRVMLVKQEGKTAAIRKFRTASWLPSE